MNREETKKAIEVMQAFVDGEVIEFRYGPDDPWDAVASPTWSWGFARNEYRIKPKPREFWVHVTNPVNPFSGIVLRHPHCAECIRVREVIE